MTGFVSMYHAALITRIDKYSHTASAFQRHKQWLKLELEQLSVVSESEGPETPTRMFNFLVHN